MTILQPPIFDGLHFLLLYASMGENGNLKRNRQPCLQVNWLVTASKIEPAGSSTRGGNSKQALVWGARDFAAALDSLTVSKTRPVGRPANQYNSSMHGILDCWCTGMVCDTGTIAFSFPVTLNAQLCKLVVWKKDASCNINIAFLWVMPFQTLEVSFYVGRSHGL